MSRLAISLLGPFQITVDGNPVTELKSERAKALLAYLAVEGDRPHRRQVLAGLLRPDQPDAVALHNLRQALSQLRQAIGDREASPPFLHVTRQTLQVSPEGETWVDVVAFREAIATCKAHQHRQAEACHECAQRL